MSSYETNTPSQLLYFELTILYENKFLLLLMPKVLCLAIIATNIITDMRKGENLKMMILSEPNSTSTQVGSDKAISWTIQSTQSNF